MNILSYLMYKREMD